MFDRGIFSGSSSLAGNSNYNSFGSLENWLYQANLKGDWKVTELESVIQFLPILEEIGKCQNW